MEKYKLKVQNDIIYLFLLLFISEVFNYLSGSAQLTVLIPIAVFGLILLETWFIRTFSLYSGRKISKYSDVIVRISLKERFFEYFILPAIFYLAILAFLYFNKHLLLGHVVLGISMCLFLVLFLNVKTSLNKLYKIGNVTRIIYDVICITILYLLINIFVRVGLAQLLVLLLVFITSLILLLFILRIHDKLGWYEMIMALLSALFISFITLVVYDLNIFVIPGITSLAFYLIISLWNVRFSGKTHLVDYLIPFLYVAIALTLILKL